MTRDAVRHVSPNSAVTLGVLTVVVEDGCPIEVLIDVCGQSLPFIVHSFTSRSSKCISTAQARRIWWAGAGALRDCALVVLSCTFSGLVISFRGRRRGNLAFWWSKGGGCALASWQVQ